MGEVAGYWDSIQVGAFLFDCYFLGGVLFEGQKFMGQFTRQPV